MKPSYRLASWFLGLLSWLPAGCTTSLVGTGRLEHSESFMSGGTKIKVEIFAPSAAGPFQTVIVLHGAGGTLLGKSEIVNVCRKLAAHGKMAMLVHYYDRTGTWVSGDKAIVKLWPLWTETVRDVVSFAVSHPRARADSIGMFGYSLGAYLSVNESSKDPRVKAVVELSGGIFEHQESQMQQMPPLLILHGRLDKRVPIAQANKVERVARKLGTHPVVKIYEGEAHVFSPEAMADAMARTLRFFDDRLP